MPDILIRVPDSIRCCGECPCFYAEHPMRCQADTHRPKRTHGAPYAGKPEWCPAKELPEHGDLVDIRAILDIAMQYVPDDDGSCSKANADLRELLDEIENVPVIVPASEEGTNDP